MDTNAVIEQFKEEVREDILRLHTQLAAIITNVDLEDVKIQLNGNNWIRWGIHLKTELQSLLYTFQQILNFWPTLSSTFKNWRIS